MAKKIKKRIPRTVQQSIPYEYLHPQGIIESENGWFSKAYTLEDINFSIAPEEEQKDIFINFEKFLNSFTIENPFQIVIHNFKADKAATLKEIRLQPERDGLNKFRNELNHVLLNKISEGNNSLRQNKYLIVSTQNDKVDDALKEMYSIDAEVANAIQNVNKAARVEYIPTEERLATLYNIYHKNEDGTFGNAQDSNGNYYLDLSTLSKQGLTSKDIIAPTGFEFKSNFFKIGETYGRALFLEKVPNFLTTDFLADLANINAEMLISLHYKPIESATALKMVKDKLLNINADIGKRQKGAAKEGYSISLLPPELEAQQAATKDLMKDIMERDQKVFYFTLCLSIFADSKQELQESIRQIDSIAGKYNCPLRTLLFQQEEGLNTCLPLGRNRIKSGKMLTTESCSIFMPYTSQEIHQKNGNLYGINQITKNLIMFDRMNERNHNFNGLFFGESGSGKSFAAKQEMLQTVLKNKKNKVYIIDPESEYGDMARALYGEVIELTPTSKTFVNPFDMDLRFGDDNDPVAEKSNYIIGMIDIICGKNNPLTPQQIGVIDRCVKNLYTDYLIHLEKIRVADPSITYDKAAAPTLNNLYNELLRQPDPEAQEVASYIEIYAQGSQNIFSHKSNVTTNAQVVVYDIKKLGSGMTPLALYICLNDIWNKMFENYEVGYNTWIYIDEFYILLQNESAAKFLMMIWKRARKWRGVPTGIMQNTEDLINSETTRQIFNNTSFMVLMSLSKMDRANLNDLLQIPESQLRFITNSKKGDGIIYTGDILLPFTNQYPRDTETFNIMNTTR